MGLKEIYKKLKMSPSNGLYILEEKQWEGVLPRRLEYLIKNKLKPDAFFCMEKKPIILFYESPKDKQKLFKTIWNFNESPIVVVSESDSVNIFNGFSYLKDIATLEKLGNRDNLINFSYFNIITGKYFAEYQKRIRQNKRVDSCLLMNIRDARNILIREYKIEGNLANALIGKCIFARYLIDRGVKIKFDGKLRRWSNNEFCNLLDNKQDVINFFTYLKTQFNGEAFLIDDDKLKKVSQKAFKVLKALLKGTQLSSGQMSLFDIYDFSVIPIEFISNVYEYFIGEQNQAKKGAYYTPKFLVDYILSETVEKYFKRNRSEYNCRVLDPACGSGIFLVEALRRIIERYKELHNGKISKIKLKQLIEDNIYGIDKDENAINVAIFSIYLTLLDYQEPKDITNFTFPNLMKNGNFHIADFFDTKAKYNSLLSKINFDFILGNPPWKRGASQDNLFLQYINIRKQKERGQDRNIPECVISNKEIAQAFLLRTSDFSNEKTQCALIVTSKTLYNINAKKFRKYFLYNFFINKVFELAPVRREIFDKSNDQAIAPAAILFFKYSHGKNTASNQLVHFCLKPNRLFSLFKIFTLQRSDIKTVVQKKLMEYDWLWKVLVYGSYLDFNLLKRLKEEYKTIGDVICDNKKYLVKQGLKIKDGQKEINVQKLKGWNFLQTSELDQYFINPKHEKWSRDQVGYIYRNTNGDYTALFTPPILLIKGGINNKFESIAAINYQKAVFKSSLTGIKTNNNDIALLRIINALLTSKLFSYSILHTGSSAGIEREESEDKEKLNTPFTNNPNLAKLVKQIEDVCRELHVAKQKPLNTTVKELEIKKQKLITQLNEEIFKNFDLNEQELTLVDYAVNVTIPLIMKHDGYEQKLFSPISFKDELLEEYIKIFLSRFKNSFTQKHLKAEIWHTTNIIGVFFKVVSNSLSDKQLIEWKNKKNETILQKIISLGTEKITEILFIQKDIRGFEKKGFYIIKPNEKNLWHKAIAYLDVNEFMNAILEAGKEMYYGENT